MKPKEAISVMSMDEQVEYCIVWMFETFDHDKICKSFLGGEYEDEKKRYGIGLSIWMNLSTDEEKKREGMRYREMEDHWIIRDAYYEMPDKVWKPKHLIGALENSYLILEPDIDLMFEDIKVVDMAPSLNRWQRMHYMQRSELKKKWSYLFLEHKVLDQEPLKKCALHLIRTYHNNYKLDTDSLYGSMKALRDGLIKQEYIIDDNPNVIVREKISQVEQPKDNQYIRVKIWNLETNG